MATSTSAVTTLSTYYNNLLETALAAKRQPLQRLTAKRDEIKIKRAVYEDLKNKVTTFETANQKVTELLTDKTSAAYTATVKSAGQLDSSLQVSLTDHQATGSYTIKVEKLAQANQKASARYDSAQDALGKNGVLVINGHNLQIENSDSLKTIVTKINALDQNQVGAAQATIIDNHLVITANKTGLVNSTMIEDSDNLFDFTETQGAQNSLLNVNGIAISTQENTSLTDTINGATLNFEPEALGKTFQVTIAPDQSQLTQALQNFTTQFNNLQDYLRNKTTSVKNADNTYTRGSLAGESSLRSLYLSLHSNLGQTVTAGSLSSLSEIGVTTNNQNYSLELDLSKLLSSLQNDRPAVTELLQQYTTRVQSTLAGFSGNSGYLQQALQTSTERLSRQETQISNYNQRLEQERSRLTKVYAQMQRQVLDYQNQYSEQNAIMKILYG